MSVIHRNHMSSTVPRNPDGAGIDGTSTIIGPSPRSRKPRAYTVSVFAVRKTDAESISSENSRIELSSTPMDRNPRRMSTSEAPGKPSTNAFTPLTKAQMVVEQFSGGLARCAVDELERSETALDVVGCGNRCQGFCRDARIRHSHRACSYWFWVSAVGCAFAALSSCPWTVSA